MTTFAPHQQAPLPQALFLAAATDVARALLGHVLVHESAAGVTAGIIVETEAYDQGDPASHSCRGQTPRTAPMFEAGGACYVYRSYGIHWCINVSTGPAGYGAAVLLRALQPIAGTPLMAERRHLTLATARDDLMLASGPGKLTQAMGITGAHSGTSLLHGPLRLVHGPTAESPEIVAAPRIGISQGREKLWRFCIAGNRYVSTPRPKPHPARV